MATPQTEKDQLGPAHVHAWQALYDRLFELVKKPQVLADEKAKKIVPRRMQNAWRRNSQLFTTALERLQAQRPALKAARRVAQVALFGTH